jgi:hypothetical protein
MHSILGFAFAPLEKYSERGAAIHKEAIDKFEKNKDSYPAGLREQLQIQIERLNYGAPGCEIITFPGFLSYPSEYLPHYTSDILYVRLNTWTDPPKPNTKYWSVFSSQNHTFSRGNVVSPSVSLLPDD